MSIQIVQQSVFCLILLTFGCAPQAHLKWQMSAPSYPVVGLTLNPLIPVLAGFDSKRFGSVSVIEEDSESRLVVCFVGYGVFQTPADGGPCDYQFRCVDLRSGRMRWEVFESGPNLQAWPTPSLPRGRQALMPVLHPVSFTDSQLSPRSEETLTIPSSEVIITTDGFKILDSGTKEILHERHNCRPNKFSIDSREDLVLIDECLNGKEAFSGGPGEGELASLYRSGKQILQFTAEKYFPRIVRAGRRPVIAGGGWAIDVNTGRKIRIAGCPVVYDGVTLVTFQDLLGTRLLAYEFIVPDEQ